MIIWSKMAQLGLEESSEVEGFRSPKQVQIEANVCVSDLGGFQAEKSEIVVGYTSPIIIIIWSKMAKLGLEESSEVEGFRRPKQAQIEAELCVSDLGGSFLVEKSDVVVGYTR